MTGKQKAGIVVLVVVAVLFYLTLGVGVMRDDGGGADADDTPYPPGWTHWLDRLTAPLQARLEPSELIYDEEPETRPRVQEWTLDGKEKLEFGVRADVAADSAEQSRRAEFLIDSDGAGATITYACPSCIEGTEVESSTLPESQDLATDERRNNRDARVERRDTGKEKTEPWPFPGEHPVRFSVLKNGGTFTFQGEGEGSHTITLK